MCNEPSLLELWHITKGWRHRFLVASLLSIVSACGSIALPFALNKVFTRIVHSEPVQELIFYIALLVLVVAFINTIEAYLVLISAEGIIRKVRKDAVEQLTELALSEYEKRPTGDLISRITTDTSVLRGAYTSGVVEGLGNIVIVIGCCSAMAYLSLPLTAVSVGVLVVSLGIMALLSRGMREITTRMQESLGVVANRLLRVLEAVRSVRAAGAMDSERKEVYSAIDSAFELGKKLSRKEAVIVPASTSVLQATLLSLLGIGGLLVGSGSLDALTLVTFLLYMMMLFMPVASIGPTLASLYRAAGAYQRLRSFEEMRREDLENEILSTDESPCIHNEHIVLSMDNLSFSYDLLESDRDDAVEPDWALQDVTLDIYRNKITAIVGPSGAGKSTLFSLLEKFYTANYGTICLDGQSIASMNLEAVRQRLAYVEQNAPLLSGSVRDNLCLGLSEVSSERCMRVLDLVGLGDLVNNLEEDVDSYIGERGVFLSGGEQQRLALARAILSDKDILLLDESTSNIDEINQTKLIAFLRECAKSKTILLIAHRRAMVEAADNVVVLNRGRVVDSGCVNAVRERCHLYQQLTGSDVFSSDR